MKTILSCLLMICMLSGCEKTDSAIEQVLSLRKELLQADSCSFEAYITADYGDDLYTFQMECRSQEDGSILFTVTDPDSISGICGTVHSDGGGFTFDDKVLLFPPITDRQLTPVSAPFLFLNTLKSGYITGCSKGEQEFCAYIDDSYQEKPLHLQITFSSASVPIHTDVIWNDRRILSMDIRNFTFL